MMSIISFSFIGVFLLAWACYYLVKVPYRWLVLLVFSVAFYLYAGVKMGAFLLCATVVTYLTALALGKMNQCQKDALTVPGADKQTVKKRYIKKKRRVLALGLILVFGALFAVKYLNFCLSGISGILGRFGQGPLPELKLLLPLGISFYSFQTAGYIIDVYRGKVQPERNLARYGLFTCFFPQMIQGPISNFNELSGQLYEGHEFSLLNMERAVYLILWGYFKKMMIADRLLLSVTRAFDMEAGYTGLAALLGAALYCLQIYTDFSGGIDICRGVAAGFGVTLPKNFRQPFFARSLNEFWQRWHITLGRWMREYIFYPIAISKPMAKLSKKLRGRSQYLARALPTAIATVAVFFLVGIWHGASLRYVAFGLYFAFFICLGIFAEPVNTRALSILHISRESRWYGAFCVLRTDFICLLGFFFARADRLSDALLLMRRSFRGIFRVDGLPFDLSPASGVVLAVCLLILITVSVLRERKIDVRAAIIKQPLWVRWALVLFSILVLLVFGVYGPGYAAADFIYMGF